MPRVHSLLRTGACVFIWLISGEALADDAGSTASADAADRKSLLEAWEQNQKSDPFTVEFEQTAPGVYHLKTTRFPYDGSVKVTSMVIRFLPNQGGTGPSKYGVVEPTLDQDIEKIQSQYPESFGDWRTRNYFQYWPDSKTWVSAADASSRLHNTALSGLGPFFSMYLFAGGVVLFIGALMVLRFREARAVQRRFKQAEEAEKRIVSNSEQRILDSKDRIALSQALQQKNHELLTEQTQLLREILSTLKQSRNP